MRKVLVVPFVGLVALTACGGSPGRVTVASGEPAGGSATTLPIEATTTSAPPATTTTTAAPATTTTTRPAATTTTRPAPKTTTTTLPKTITVTAVPNQYYTDVIVKGAGCAGPEYGVSLEIRDPSGQPFDGTGGLAAPDGTWELHQGFNSARPAGQYSFHARCVVTNGPDVFAYAPQTFTWTG